MRHVEVKGIQGGQLQFFMTRNEYAKLHDDEHFRLAVVVNALQNSRRVVIWNRVRAEAKLSFTPELFKVRSKPARRRRTLRA